MSRFTSTIMVGLLSATALLAVSGPRASADTSAVPPTPTNLTMSAGDGSQLPAGSWINSRQITFHFDVQTTTGSLTPEVELEPASVPFKNQGNVETEPVATSGQATVAVEGLSNRQTYHWQARVVDSSGLASAWAPFAAPGATGPDFGVDQDPPGRPTVQSPTNPNQTQWYNNRTVVLRWTDRDTLSGIKGYSYLLGRRAGGMPPSTLQSQPQLRVDTLADGVWFFSVRAQDRAGNWSPLATFRLQLDRQAPQLTWLSPTRYAFNPYRGPTSVRFRVSKDASVRLALYRVGDRAPVQVYSFSHLQAGQVTTITWSGKDQRGRPMRSGYYFFSATAVDHARNIDRVNLGGIELQPLQPQQTASGVVLYPGDGKRIVVSLSRQTLYAYDGTRLVLQTVVTTGNPSLPTPTGSFTVLAKYHPFEFVSPWPPGSPYWYAPSWSTYAMLFQGQGYFLHDAPWRSAFGPGTNGPGQPGTNFGGTHGCVNIPPSPMLFLWNWTPVGTPVLVVP